MKKSKIVLLGLMILPLLNLTISAVFALYPAGHLNLLQNETATEGTATGSDKFLGMGLSTGLAAIGAGIAVGYTGSSAIASITEKPEMFGRSMIIVGLAEGIAIYGLLISFLIWIS